MELEYCVTVAYSMTERAHQRIYLNAPAHCTALLQAFFGKTLHHPGLSAPPEPDLAPYDFWYFPKLNLPLRVRRFVNAAVTQ